MVEEFVKLMIQGERAGRGKIVTRVLYDMFEMFFPAKSKAKVKWVIKRKLTN